MNKKKMTEFFKSERNPIIIIILITLAGYFVQFDKKLDLNGDNIHYYHLGQNIKNGEGYTSTWEPESPPHKHFPPGYPLIIAFFSFISSSVVFIKLLNGFFLIITALILYKILRRNQLPVILALIISVFFVNNPFLLRHATIMMSEVPFVLTILLTILFYQSADRDKKMNMYFIFMILVIAYGFYIKTIGISIFFGVCTLFLVKKEYKHLISTIILFILLTVPWIIRNQNIKSLTETSYIQEFLMKNPYHPHLGYVGIGDLFNRFYINFQKYFSVEIPSFLFPSFRQSLEKHITAGWALGIIIIGISIYGLTKLKKNEKIFYLSTLSAIMGIILLWPDVWSGTRFLLPASPFIFILFYCGLSTLLTSICRWIGFSFNNIFLFIFIFFYFQPIYEQHLRAKMDYHPQYEDYFNIAQEAGQKLDHSSIVSCRKPVFFYHFSGLKSIKYPFTTDNDEMIKFFTDHKVTHVVIEYLGYSSTPKYLIPTIKNRPEHFEIQIEKNSHKSYPSQYLLKFIP